jgi:8-oxo-dGTP diphosphatase
LNRSSGADRSGRFHAENGGFFMKRRSDAEKEGRRDRSMAVRSCVKAIVMRDGKVLLNRCRDEKGECYYTFPGGGQNPFETMRDALVRECAEETGYRVVPGAFVGMCEEIVGDPEARERFGKYAHKVYHFFRCDLADETPGVPAETDSTQTGVEWLGADEAQKARLLPEGAWNMICGESGAFFSSRMV